MKKYAFTALASTLAFVAVSASAQGIGHGYFMRGSVVGADSKGTVVCIGSADGAEVGQVLEVYKVSSHPGPNKLGTPLFHRNLVGHVRIDHVFDSHFAHVSVTDGHASKSDIVELKKI
jgi:hypothetical protein